MMADVAKDPAWRERARALTQQLRGVIEALNGNAPGADALDQALALVRELRTRLEGPRRERYYDVDDARRPAYQDMGPVRGHLNPIAPPLAIRVLDRSPDKLRVEGRARLGLAYEAPPKGVHGGWVAALFDDLLSAAQGLSPEVGYTTSLLVRYHAVTPLDQELRLEAWLAEEDGRRVVMKGECWAGDRLTAEAEGTFVRVDFYDPRHQGDAAKEG